MRITTAEAELAGGGGADAGGGVATQGEEVPTGQRHSCIPPVADRRSTLRTRFWGIPVSDDTAALYAAIWPEYVSPIRLENSSGVSSRRFAFVLKS